MWLLLARTEKHVFFFVCRGVEARRGELLFAVKLKSLIFFTLVDPLLCGHFSLLGVATTQYCTIPDNAPSLLVLAAGVEGSARRGQFLFAQFLEIEHPLRGIIQPHIHGMQRNTACCARASERASLALLRGLCQNIVTGGAGCRIGVNSPLSRCRGLWLIDHLHLHRVSMFAGNCTTLFPGDRANNP